MATTELTNETKKDEDLLGGDKNVLSDQTYLGQGSSLYASSSAKLKPTVRVYTSSDTWTKPGGLKYLMVELVGGGGGSGGTSSDNQATGGGGGGGYSKKFISAVDLGTTETVTIGAGGSGGSGSGGTGGTAGGTSSFGTVVLLQATGGGATAVNVEQGADGGSGSGGDINIQGGGGGSGGAASADGMGGQGGSSILGLGGKAANVDTNGSNGTLYGGGGGGCASNPTARNGGAGADGVVIVTEYF